MITLPKNSEMAHPASDLDKGASRPTGLHHNAFVCADQARTRAFYEDVLGLPLVAFWIEDDSSLGERHVFSHSLYELRDGGTLAFFNFDDPALAERYRPKPQNLFVHIALRTDPIAQAALRERLRKAGKEVMEIDHGYTYSMYVTDPDGLLIELAADPPEAEAMNSRQRREARRFFDQWMAGNRTPNNHER